MLQYIQLNYYFKLALFSELLNIKSKDNAYLESLKSHFNHKTYRFSTNAPKDYLISLRVLKMIINSFFKKPKLSENKNVTSSIAIYDTSLNETNLRYEYVKRLSGDEAKIHLGKEELKTCGSVALTFFTFVALLVLYPFIIVGSFFSKNKLKYPLHILNWMEAVNMLYQLKKYKINKLHFFCIYENDANLLAYSLMKVGIEVNKIPSEVPLQFWNKTVVADCLSFCFRYQRDEFEHFKKTMFVKETKDWIPEKSLTLEKFYDNNNRKSKKNVIGFYSSAMWLRKEKGTMTFEDSNNYELELLRNLNEFISMNAEFSLLVFLHPLEKKNLERAKNYYTKLPFKCEIADVNIDNTQQFYEADVVVTLFSTLAFERIFWGFKTLIYPVGQTNFPVEGSKFNSLCAKTKMELFEKLKDALSFTTEEYFKVKDISEYCYYNYECFNRKVA